MVVERKARVVRTLAGGIKKSLKAAGVEVVDSSAQIKGKNGCGLEVSAGNETYLGKNILLATGSVPVIPPIAGLHESLKNGFAMTSREILDIREVPERFVVIGGGVVGIEMASYFLSAGAEVTVIEMMDKIGGMGMDKDISNILRKNYEKKGMSFKFGAKVVHIQTGVVKYEQNGDTYALDTDKVLLSVGRRPYTENLGLDIVGVKTVNEAIITDYRMRTNIEGIFAAGDVTGKSMLAHTAYREAEVAVNNMLGKNDVMRYTAIPGVIYTSPEVGCVGETEETATEKGMEILVRTLPMNYSGRYMAENERGDGNVKVIVNKQTHHLVGFHMIGSYASEIIYGLGILIEKQTAIEEMHKFVFPHPTVGEIIREAVF